MPPIDARSLPRSNIFTAAGQDHSVHIGKDGTVTLDKATIPASEEKAAEALRKTGNFLVLPIANGAFGEAVRDLVVHYMNDQRPQMVESFGHLSDAVIVKAGATRIDPDAVAGAPPYKGLPEAAFSGAAAVTGYTVETHNAHADPEWLSQGGLTLSTLLSLSDVFSTGVDRVGLTTAPLARELAGTVSEVCLVSKEELPRNPGLKRTLGPALDYSTARVIRGQQTKRKIAAVKAKMAATAPVQQAGGGVAGAPAAGGSVTGEKSSMR